MGNGEAEGWRQVGEEIGGGEEGKMILVQVALCEPLALCDSVARYDPIFRSNSVTLHDSVVTL